MAQSAGGVRTAGSLRSSGLRLALAALLLACGIAAPAARPLDAASFGWRRIEAAGSRPLLVIWLREADDTPMSELLRRKQRYEDLLFGHDFGDREFPDALRVLHPSLVGYYRDISGGRFSWTRAGFIGPLTARGEAKTTIDEAKRALATAATEGHFDFRAFDTNHDGVISPRELAVLVINNRTVSAGQADHFITPASGGGRGAPPRPFAIPGQGVSFAAADALVGEGGFASMAHELFHGLGGGDLYGPWGGCYGMNAFVTLMGGTGSGTPDDERVYHLDPWHKMLVGWTEPRVIELGAAGAAELAAAGMDLATAPERKRPVLLYSAERGASEFFLLEYRTPYRLGYDRDVASSGLMIWHVQYNRDGYTTLIDSDRKDCRNETVKVPSIFTRGAPDWRQGGSLAYTSAHGPIALRWMDGRDSGVRLQVAPHKPTDPVLSVSWSAPETSRARRAGP